MTRSLQFFVVSHYMQLGKAQGPGLCCFGSGQSVGDLGVHQKGKPLVADRIHHVDASGRAHLETPKEGLWDSCLGGSDIQPGVMSTSAFTKEAFMKHQKRAAARATAPAAAEATEEKERLGRATKVPGLCGW